MKNRYEMSKKEYQQSLENSVALGIFQSAINELDAMSTYHDERLRTCNARVVETSNYYILASYHTFVAAIDKRTFQIADVLRYVYGYTSTSAQHISKFIHDYTPYTWNSPRYTYRDI